MKTRKLQTNKSADNEENVERAAATPCGWLRSEERNKNEFLMTPTPG